MDSGWSWVVCAASFLSNVLVVGFGYNIGIYYAEFLKVLRT